MTYDFNDNLETANLISLIQEDDNQFDLTDFMRFTITFKDAIQKSQRVDLRFDTNKGLDVHTGKIQNAKINYNSANPNPCVLDFDLKILSSGIVENYSFSFNAEFIEENTFSKPGNFMKYYINDNNNHKVIVGFIFDQR